MKKLVGSFKQDMISLFFLALSVFLMLALVSYNPTDPSFNSLGRSRQVANWCGILGSFISDTIFQTIGIGAWIMALVMLRSSIAKLGKKTEFRWIQLTVWLILICLTATLAATMFPALSLYQKQIPLGGALGLGVSHLLVHFLNPIGVHIFLWFWLALTTVFLSQKSLGEITHAQWKRVKNFGVWLRSFETKANTVGKSVKPEKVSAPTNVTALKAEAKVESKNEPSFLQPLKDFVVETLSDEKGSEKKRPIKKAESIENWELPKMSLIEDPPSARIRVDEKEIRRKAELLTEKLALFDVRGEVVSAKPGPAVTMYEFRPDADVKLSKITDLADDLSLALSSASLRILAPIPGRDVVGIETSNSQREVVYMKDMLAEEEFWNDDIKLPFALGRQVSGQPAIADLRKMPHMMVAGTTGSGKSVFTVSTITGLICKHSPQTLKLILIDPKQVDLAAFEHLPHLAMPLVTDSKQAVLALKWAVTEMEKRYRSMSKFSTRGLEDYNKAVAAMSADEARKHATTNDEMEQTPGKKFDKYYYKPLPYMVIVVEEFADLMTVDKANVEQSVVRLAQKARACGIHLILCLQSPRREFVTGPIKSNITGRIAFKASSRLESQIVLDEPGAERLLAQGDMLYRGPGTSNVVRHHGPYLKDSDIKAIADFWSKQRDSAEYEETAVLALQGNLSSEGEGGENLDSEIGGFEDDRYREILNWVCSQKEVSASLIQRRFQLGYPRAARLVENLEREGVIGPAQGSKPRQVLFSTAV